MPKVNRSRLYNQIIIALKGICALSYTDEKALMVFPSRQEGYIHIVDLLDNESSSLIRAHKSRIASIAISPDGFKVASASRKGTLVRVFNTANGRPEHELRRGSDRALIFKYHFTSILCYSSVDSIRFSFDGHRLCVSSDKGTVHIFRLEKPQEGLTCLSDDEEEILESAPPKNPLAIPFVKDILPKYFSSKWSFANFHVNDTRFIATFGSEKNTVVAVSSDGNYYKYAFDLAKGGECIRQAYNKFLQIGDLN